MSKKIAEGIDALVLDVKTGRGAFMKTARRRRAQLAESLVVDRQRAPASAPKRSSPRWSMPLGRAVGNALEVIERIETLKGQRPRRSRTAVGASSRRACSCSAARRRIDDRRGSAGAQGDRVGRRASRSSARSSSGRAAIRASSTTTRRLPQAPIAAHRARAERAGVARRPRRRTDRPRHRACSARAASASTTPIDPGVGAIMRCWATSSLRRSDCVLRAANAAARAARTARTAIATRRRRVLDAVAPGRSRWQHREELDVDERRRPTRRRARGRPRAQRWEREVVAMAAVALSRADRAIRRPASSVPGRLILASIACFSTNRRAIDWTTVAWGLGPAVHVRADRPARRRGGADVFAARSARSITQAAGVLGRRRRVRVRPARRARRVWAEDHEHACSGAGGAQHARRSSRSRCCRRSSSSPRCSRSSTTSA